MGCGEMGRGAGVGKVVESEEDELAMPGISPQI